MVHQHNCLMNYSYRQGGLLQIQWEKNLFDVEQCSPAPFDGDKLSRIRAPHPPAQG